MEGSGLKSGRNTAHSEVLRASSQSLLRQWQKQYQEFSKNILFKPLLSVHYTIRQWNYNDLASLNYAAEFPLNRHDSSARNIFMFAHWENWISHKDLGGLREGIHLFLSERLGRIALRLSMYKTRVNCLQSGNVTCTNHVTQTVVRVMRLPKCLLKKNKMAAWMFPYTIKIKRILRPFISHSSQPLMSDTGDRVCLKCGTKMPRLGRHRPLISDMRVFSAELFSFIRTKWTGSLCFTLSASKNDKRHWVLFCPEIPDIWRNIFKILFDFSTLQDDITKLSGNLLLSDTTLYLSYRL
jgi:hypothetical protein